MGDGQQHELNLIEVHLGNHLHHFPEFLQSKLLSVSNELLEKHTLSVALTS